MMPELSRWNLAFHPFASAPSARVDVAIGSQRAIVQILSDRLARRDRHIVLTGQPLVGKSYLLKRVLRRTAVPGVRVALACGSSSEIEVIAELARAVSRERRSARAFESTQAAAQLRRAVQLRLLEGLVVILAVDQAEAIAHRDWSKAVSGSFPDGWPVTILEVRRDPGLAAGAAATLGAGSHVVLPAWTRSEARDYVRQKWGAAGGRSEVWSDEALTRLHALAGGCPGRIDALAAASMRHAHESNRAHIGASMVERAWFGLEGFLAA